MGTVTIKPNGWTYSHVTRIAQMAIELLTFAADPRFQCDELSKLSTK
jgi:hypothetical protein